MFLAVKDYLTANAALLTPLPNYSGYFTSFTSSITQIQANAEQQQFDKTGITKNKNLLKETLITQTLDMAHRIVAYARFVNNQVLLKETDIKNYQLLKLSDTGLRDAAQGIYNRALANQTALNTYGVTNATLGTLQNAITAFVAAIPKPRIGIAERKQYSKLLEGYIVAAETALENIDATVRLIELSQVNFYAEYKNLRRIIDTSGNFLAMNGKVTETTDGMPIKGVTVTVSTDGALLKQDQGTAAKKDMVKKTADKGGFRIKSLPAGIYKVNFSKLGYTDQNVSVVVNEGETTFVKVQLAKNL